VGAAASKSLAPSKSDGDEKTGLEICAARWKSLSAHCENAGQDGFIGRRQGSRREEECRLQRETPANRRRLVGSGIIDPPKVVRCRSAAERGFRIAGLLPPDRRAVSGAAKKRPPRRAKATIRDGWRLVVFRAGNTPLGLGRDGWRIPFVHQ